MNRKHSAARSLLGGISIAAAISFTPVSSHLYAETPPPQLTPADAALVKLNAGRRAFNEKNYPLALSTFKEFLAGNASHHEAAGAWYGVGLCILQTAQPDYTAAADAFKKAAAGDFPDRPMAMYYWGSTLRVLGNRAMADAQPGRGDSDKALAAANQRYTEAAAQFLAAQTAFAGRIKETPGEKEALPIDLEWSARARCDTSEMMIRLGKYKEAIEASLPFQADPVIARSRYRGLGLYHLGHAQFALRDYLAAGRSLSQLAPFNQEFGLHARYLLGRIHHLADEGPEAAAQYKVVQEEFDARRKAAVETVKAAGLDPERKAQLEALARGPLPDYVLRARFYGAVLQYEGGLYADAAQAFTTIIQQQANDPIVPEAKLRLGFCQLQLHKFNEAIQALDPLKDDKRFGDRATWWLARAKIGAADPANAAAYTKTLAAAVDSLRSAADRAQKMAPTDPDAKVRRIDILIELADTQQLSKHYKEAAATYQQIAADAPQSDRAEEAMQRRVTALHLAGQFKESDAAADQFLKSYPKSTLLPAALFRQAENAYMTALAASDEKASRPREEQVKLFTAAIERYQKLIAKYPEFDYADLARQALATCHSRLGQYTEAVAVLQTIPESSRAGDLASVPYLLADSEIRTLPPEAEDALTAERLIDTAADAAKYLESFLGAQPKSAQAPDALLKLGYCYQRMASQMAVPDDRQKTLAKARDAYDRFLQQFKDDPAQPAVTFERAKCLALMGDVGGAQNELKKFQADPLRKTPNAPLAMIRLSALLRSAGQAQPAVDVMKKCRDEFETALAADPARSGWLPMMRYEHALALQDAHKLPEALAILQEIAKQSPGKPEAVNASWRIAQCRRQDASEKLAEARNIAARPGVNPNEIATAYSHVDAPLAILAQAAELLKTQTEAQATVAAHSEATLRMLYELAWCYRVAADADTDAARLKLQHDAVEKFRAHWPKNMPSPAAVLAAPQISPAEIPITPAEQKAREYYQRLIFAAPAAELASQARFEMAELLCQRGEIDPALDLLATALENQPSKALAQRIKIRVAAALLAKNNPQPALAQVTPILADKTTPLAAEAKYLAGEAYIQQQDWPKAVETLAAFRDQDPFRNAQGFADRALMRLGYALEQSNQWDTGRQSFEAVISRFPQSPYIDQARYSAGWCNQNQKRFDAAVNLYTELTHRSVSESAARAQLNIGMCRIEQKRPGDALDALLLVPLIYDYPDLSAAAVYHAARAHLESQKPQEAAKLLRRVLKDYPGTQWASLAQKRLDEIK